MRTIFTKEEYEARVFEDEVWRSYYKAMGYTPEEIEKAMPTAGVFCPSKPRSWIKKRYKAFLKIKENGGEAK
jgi:hypothetical protein